MSDARTQIGIIGCGIIGASWAQAFLRVGHAVTVCDPGAEAAALKARLDGADGQLRIVPGPEGLADCGYVQESITEDAAAKRALFAKLDEVVPRDCIVASSTSALCMSDLVETLPGRGRFLVAHPASPPHALPAVEIVPAPFTEPGCVDRAESLLTGIGQTPVRLAREEPGFVLNRLQGALLLAMIDVVRDGLVSAEGADALLRDSFGMRWALMGPFEGVHLNAPGGIDDYFTRYAAMFDRFCPDGRTLEDVLAPQARAALKTYAEARVPPGAADARRAWRDEALAGLRDWRDGAGA